MPQDESRGRDGRRNGSGSGAESLLAALRSKELLVPAALGAAGVVAASRGPDIVRRLTSATGERGEGEARRLGEQAGRGALQALRPGGGGKSKKTRRLPIQRWTDVAVPVEQAYRAWTRFDDYPRFMHRVLNVRRQGDDRVEWQEKIWFSTRDWEGRITDRRPNDRIAWKTTRGTSHSGVVSFHRLDDRLTRVMVTVDFEPTGTMEKLASGLRFVKRAVQADLARFKAYVELEDAKGLGYRVTRGGDRQPAARGQNGGRPASNPREREGRRRGREQRRARRREPASA